MDWSRIEAVDWPRSGNSEGNATQVAGEVKTRDQRGFQDGVVRVHPRINHSHNPGTSGKDLMGLRALKQHDGRLVDVTAHTGLS